MKLFQLQTGQAMPEYLIMTSIFVFSLFVPWNGEPSVVAQFLEAVRTYHTQASFPLSLP